MSIMSMKSIMSLIDIAFYHGYLPEKAYYKGNFLKVNVPHGIYDNVEIDLALLSHIRELSKGYSLLGILGNIRQEKNYEIL